MKILSSAIFLLCLQSANVAAALLFPIDHSPPTLLFVGSATDPDCNPQVANSSCRSKNFPRYVPDPMIPSEPAHKDRPKTTDIPKPDANLKSQDCRYGSPKCYCTNNMAVEKAKLLGVNVSSVFGYVGRVVVSGKRAKKRIALTISRERTCPVIGEE
jgi:hypothetical protein